MSRSSLIAIIAVTLIGFLLFKSAVSLICQPAEKNSVAMIASNVLSIGKPSEEPAKPDPLSWEPVIHYVVTFVSKACPS
ncbi:hypothetical protein [Polynucleobacter asymbioticus]|jgi:hypothetical protein|uniref:hypothetical protein n=1 Tax=Polynucleobacter asymbioticus TaxID=576611 RepID=UPI0008F93698|nr:hypothetical protein [Polynucleobacter asymbioticus]